MSLRRRQVAVAAGALAALLLAAAVAVATGWRSTSTANDAGWLDSLQEVQGRWTSRAGFAYDGTEPWTAPVALTVDGDRLGMTAGCNSMGATVRVRDHRLHADGGVAMTMMGCDQARHARDAWLAALVEDHASIQLKGSTEGPMLMLDTNAGWIGFVRTPHQPLVTVSEPDQPVSSTSSP